MYSCPDPRHHQFMAKLAPSTPNQDPEMVYTLPLVGMSFKFLLICRFHVHLCFLFFIKSSVENIVFFKKDFTDFLEGREGGRETKRGRETSI